MGAEKGDQPGRLEAGRPQRRHGLAPLPEAYHKLVPGNQKITLPCLSSFHAASSWWYTIIYLLVRGKSNTIKASLAAKSWMLAVRIALCKAIRTRGHAFSFPSENAGRPVSIPEYLLTDISIQLHFG